MNPLLIIVLVIVGLVVFIGWGMRLLANRSGPTVQGQPWQHPEAERQGQWGTHAEAGRGVPRIAIVLLSMLAVFGVAAAIAVFMLTPAGSFK